MTYDQKTVFDAVANVLYHKHKVKPEKAQGIAREVVERLSSEAVNALCRGQKGLRRLSPPERIVLDFVIKFIGNNQRPPTIQEIADGTERGTTTINYHLARLGTAGYITRIPRQHRSIKVL